MMKLQEKWVVLAGMAIFVVAVVGLAWWKWQHGAYNGVDLAIYAQALWNTAHGRFLATSIHPTTLLGDHAEWLVVALTPLYALFPHPLVLVVVQACALAASGWVVWRIAKRTLPPRWALGASLGVLLLPTIGSASIYEFHPLVLALPLLLLAADAFQEKQLLRFVLLASACLLVREDVTLTVAAFGIVGLIERRSWKWIIVPIVASSVWFVAMQFVISHFAATSSYKYLAYYGWLWSLSLGDVVRHLFTLPQAEFLLGLMMPVLFLPLLKPKWLLLSLPSTALLMLTNAGTGDTVLRMHYAIIPLAGIILASLESLPTLLNRDRRLIAVILGTALVGSAVMLGPFFQAPLAIAQTRPATAISRAIAAIPTNASVAAHPRLLPYLAHREQLISLRYLALGHQQFGTTEYNPPAPDFLLFDDADFVAAAGDADLAWTKDAYPGSFARLRSLIDDGYGLVFRDGTVSVWQKGVERPHFDLSADQYAAIAPGIRMSVADTPELCPGNAGVCTTLLFQTDHDISEELFLAITATAGNKKTAVTHTFRLQPTFDWGPGTTITLPLPELPTLETTDPVTYQAELVRGTVIPTLDILGSTTVELTGPEALGPAVTIARITPSAGTPDATPVRPE